jgi:hypothetical protein
VTDAGLEAIANENLGLERRLLLIRANHHRFDLLANELIALPFRRNVSTTALAGLVGEMTYAVAAHVVRRTL